MDSTRSGVGFPRIAVLLCIGIAAIVIGLVAARLGVLDQPVFAVPNRTRLKKGRSARSFLPDNFWDFESPVFDRVTYSVVGVAVNFPNVLSFCSFHACSRVQICTDP
jgi:hypothetical protein